MKLRTFVLYFSFALFISAWWLAAFRPARGQESKTEFDFDLKNQLSNASFPFQLSSMDRGDILKALNGDLPLMVKLISDWDLDGQILEGQGLIGIKRLPQDALLRTHLLDRIFRNTPREELLALQSAYRLKGIIDDNGSIIPLKENFQFFLPQTHVAASFLLALAEPSQIVAIPKGIREQTQLYSPQLTSQIKFDIDRYNGEHFFQTKPQVAFVSHYSHPATLQALQNQGIQLFSLNTVETLPDIRNALIRIGNVINRPFEAELLTIFMEGAMLAVDNRLKAFDHCQGTHYAGQRLLYLNYHMQYTSPSSKTLTWQLLERLGVSQCLPEALISAHASDWSIPMDQEQIVSYSPDCLILATSNREFTARQIESTFAFHTLPAVCQQRVFFVDETVQHSPSQYIVLAYYDLGNALSGNKLNQVPAYQQPLLSSNQP